MAHIVLVVLGDVGRSPRMQYQAISAAKLKWVTRVTIVGYTGEKCIQGLKDEKIHEVRFDVGDFLWLRKISLLHAIAKGMHLMFNLLGILLRLPNYDSIVIQNPPCLPVLIVALFMGVIGGSKVIVDWHNLGFKMFEERLGPEHTVVRLAKTMEKSITRLADAHVCVSEAMKQWLHSNFGIRAVVVYDKPAEIFSRHGTGICERHELLKRLQFTDAKLFCGMKLSNGAVDENDTGTIHTMMTKSGEVQLRDDRTFLLLSSTSWTPDEDFNILLNALLLLDHGWSSDSSHKKSRLLVAVTGKGPLKETFEKNVADLEKEGKLQHIRIRTVWLESEDYPLLMGCADLGVCLHTSTSGVDLPMKVLDMFGSGVPVCAAYFPAIGELVRDGHNGLIFKSSSELHAQLQSLLSVDGRAELAHLRDGAALIGTWDDNWTACMEPVLTTVTKERLQYKAMRDLLKWAVCTVFTVVIMAAGKGLLRGLLSHSRAKSA